MTTTTLVDSYRAAISAVEVGPPRNLVSRAKNEGDDRDANADVSVEAFAAYLTTSNVNDPLRMQLHLALARWDNASAALEWTNDTPAGSPERRGEIYGRLSLPEEVRPVFDELFHLPSGGTVVISEDFSPWYTDERRNRHPFYWPAYSKYLREKNSWEPEPIAALDEATTKIVERLAEPEREDAYQAKGLVVGYVQSGKTANFTGVVSKAIDAGYRLIIIMTGTVDLLREQTQRRMDMELVGKENILRGVDPSDADLMRDVDYQQDETWDSRFVEHGGQPSDLNFPDIIRLTTHQFDYKSLRAGLVALEFEKADRSKPLYDPANLPTSNARLVIVKKNKSVLTKLVKDLRSIKGRLPEIPALIIDDESDEASVNTTNPAKWAADTPEREERTAINGLISDLLTLLPRAQYIGYTATPFANVFIDPGDTENIFPKDFLISLDRPPDYMGVSDFHDLDPDMEGVEKTLHNSNEKCLVRAVTGQGVARIPELREAIDAFVISGAIKLYRQAFHPALSFKHHTMLVHESVRQAEHAALAREIDDMWATAGYTSGSGFPRLQDLYESDFEPVCRARPDGPLPLAFSELIPHITTTVKRIEDNGSPVIVVNGDKQMSSEEVAFDKRSVWRILVGGAKLSRGFTVEGLTVSYYRRKTKQAATLMQMGRWFGFRKGYKDLIRLYIGRAEPDGAGTLDLYEAFEGIVRDEEAFRLQLRQYAQLVDGHPLMTPRDVPPLVSQHLPWLPPVAKNKMFNARMVVRRTTGSLVIPTGYPKEPPTRARNFSATLPLLSHATTYSDALVVPEAPNLTRGTFSAYFGLVPHAEFADVLGQLEWITKEYYEPEIAFVQELADRVDDWVVILPQLEGPDNRKTLGGLERSVFKRQLKPPHFHLWGEPTDRKHRPAALRIAGARLSDGDATIDGLCHPRRGAVLIYPMNENPAALPNSVTGTELVMGIAWAVPTSVAVGGSQVVQFETRNSRKKRDAIVNTND